MKKTLLILAVLIIPVFLAGQETPLAKFYERYASEQGFKVHEILPGSTSMEWEKDLRIDHLREIMDNIDYIRILTYQGEGKIATNDLMKKLDKAINKDEYKEIVSVKADDGMLKAFFLKGETGRIHELALIANGKEGLFIFTVTGDIDFNMILSSGTMADLQAIGKYYIDSKGECGEK